MGKKDEKPSTPNPNGQNGKPLTIPLDFDEALRAALETPPPAKRKRPKAGTK